MLLLYVFYNVFMLISGVSGREAVVSTDDVKSLVTVLNDLTAHEVNATNGERERELSCLLHVHTDLPRVNESQPLYIAPYTNRFWLPNVKGELLVLHGSNIELHCPDAENESNDKNKIVNTYNGGGFKMAQNIETIRPHCLHGTTFLWQGVKYELRQFVCRQRPRYTVERTNVSCADLDVILGKQLVAIANAAKIYRVGYRISNPKRFIETMKTCYDEILLRAHYVQYVLTPGNIYFQKMVKRLNFQKVGHFKDWNMNYLYSQRNQYQLLCGHNGYLFDNRTGSYLTRGHLAAKADFVFANQQRTTFNFFNVAPQWQTFNGGQWSVLEDEVRKFVAKSKLHVNCYTGTWGTVQLSLHTCATPSSSEWRELYLAMDSNNNGVLPVPRLYYRILIDSSESIRRRGIALIGVNNPHASFTEIFESYVICTDIREQVEWLRWIRNNNLKKGYLYACRVADLAKAVGHLPTHLMNINEILQ